MDFNKQGYPLWGKDKMTECTEPNWEGKVWTDTLDRWGCIVTCLANIIQIFRNKPFTPKDLNNYLVAHNGYRYLRDKKTPEAEASFVEWPVVEANFRIEVKYTKGTSGYRFREGWEWIARIQNSQGGHYINVIRKIGRSYICFDVYTGQTSVIPEQKITALISVKAK